MTTKSESAAATEETLLTTGQLADYLGWSVRFIDGLARGGKLPALEIGGQFRFRRDDVIEWLEQKLYTLDAPRVTELESKLEHDLLAQGIFRRPRQDRWTSRLPIEGIALDIQATTKSDVLKSLVSLASATGLLYDPEVLLTSLVEREALCSTAMPGGFALCHPRRPIATAIEKEFVCFLRTTEPVDFDAEDGQKTSLFFLLCAPDERTHLHGLARLARLLKPSATGMLLTLNSAEAVLEHFLQLEQALVSSPSA